MTPKALYYAHALFELAKEARPEEAARSVKRLSRMLRAQNRGGLLERIFSEYRRLLLERNAALDIEVRSAATLSDTLLKEIREKMGAPDGVKISQTVDPSLIGGVMVKYNDSLFDSTLKRKLNSMEYTFLT